MVPGREWWGSRDFTTHDPPDDLEAVELLAHSELPVGDR